MVWSSAWTFLCVTKDKFHMTNYEFSHFNKGQMINQYVQGEILQLLLCSLCKKRQLLASQHAWSQQPERPALGQEDHRPTGAASLTWPSLRIHLSQAQEYHQETRFEDADPIKMDVTSHNGGAQDPRRILSGVREDVAENRTRLDSRAVVSNRR